MSVILAVMATTDLPTHSPIMENGRTNGRTGRRLLLLAGVLLVAANLRIVVTSLGAVLDEVSRDLAMHAAASSFVTTLPVLCFGVIAFAAPWIVRRLGPRAGIAAAVLVLTVGAVVRVIDGPIALVVGTFLACAGIATANVLLPVVVKIDFGHRVGQVTGLYSAVMATGAAVGAGTTVQVSHAVGGWRGGLLVWAALAALALLVWLPNTRRTKGPRAARASIRPLLSDPVAWAVTVLFATQSLIAYVVMGWLPAIFRDAGLSPSQAGGLLGLSILIGVPLNFAIPVLAGRLRNQSLLAASLTSCSVIGFLGLLVAPLTVPWLWVLLLGVGGAVFPLNLVLFNLRTSTGPDTAALSATAQGIGYLLAAGGPFLIGLLRELTGSWSVSLLAVLAVLAVQLVAGYAAGRNRYVDTAPTTGSGRRLDRS